MRRGRMRGVAECAAWRDTRRGVMRNTAGEIANALAWAVLLVLVGVAILIADWLGFAGLFILGMLTWVICTQVELGDDTPIASAAVFRAKMAQERSPERRAPRLLLPPPWRGRSGRAWR